MTQDESWLTMWWSIMGFMEANQRRPSRYYPEERPIHTWWKQNKKLLSAGKLKEERVAMFERLLEVGEMGERGVVWGVRKVIWNNRIEWVS